MTAPSTVSGSLPPGFDAGGPAAQEGTGQLDQVAEYVAELFARLSASVLGTRTAEHVGLDVPTDETAEIVDGARDLLVYLDAHWYPVAVPRRGGRKRRRSTRLLNPAGSITQLSNAWAAQTGRSRAGPRGCLALLAHSGAIFREPSGRGYAWRLERQGEPAGRKRMENP